MTRVAEDRPVLGSGLPSQPTQLTRPSQPVRAPALGISLREALELPALRGAEVLAGACPIVASYGAKDRGISGGATKLSAVLDEVGVTADVKEYPEAAHGFLNRYNPVSPLTTIAKVAGVGYHHASAADAKRRILRFFDTHLRG